MTGKLIMALHEMPTVTVVERKKLELALNELSTGSTDLVDDSTKLQVGKILGASHMVFGGYQVFGDMMRLDIRLVEVETGKMVKAAQKTVPASDLSQWLTAGENAGKELFE